MARYEYENGYCPKQEDYETISVKYTRVPVMGITEPGHKRIGFECEFAMEYGCSFENKCPVYEEAPLIL